MSSQWLSRWVLHPTVHTLLTGSLCVTCSQHSLYLLTQYILSPIHFHSTSLEKVASHHVISTITLTYTLVNLSLCLHPLLCLCVKPPFAVSQKNTSTVHPKFRRTSSQDPSIHYICKDLISKQIPPLSPGSQNLDVPHPPESHQRQSTFVKHQHNHWNMQNALEILVVAPFIENKLLMRRTKNSPPF